MWMSLAFMGCGGPSQPDGQDPVVTTGEVDLSLEPEALDFGLVPLGGSAEQTLTIHNNGTSDVLVGQIVLSDQETLAVHGFSSPKILAGDQTELAIEWTPSETGDLVDDTLDLRVGVQLADLSDLEVPLAGKVSGPHLTLSESSVDLGTVLVGCTQTFDAVATNSGNETLTISRITLTDDREFAVEDGTGKPLQLPVQLGSGESTNIDVVYTPMDEHDVSTTLQIESNDALAPTANVRVDGTGHIEGSNSITWTVEGQQAVTAIINVNQYAMSTGFSDDMEDFLPALFGALLDADVSFRLGIVMNETGYVSGDIPYIDDTFTVDEAVDAATDMLDGTSAYGDNDTGLQTCLNSLDENDWLWDDGGIWTRSRLNFMVINNDVEQSPGNAEHYVDEYEDRKNEGDGTGDFVVHGIAGPTGGGCRGDGEYAEPSQNLYDATDLTGGVFVTICDDWSDSVPDLIDAFTGTIETFELTGEPAPWSIEVRVNGVELFEGWTYDAKTKQVVFDDAIYPERGSELRIDYLMAVGCD